MNFLLLEEVDSTNSYVAVHAAELEDMTMVIADSQTAGRGQRGNSWESEQGKNLTFTLLYKPQGIAPREQFAISEAAALAVADFLVESGMEAKVKWPNDIYAGDRKISGILIEHALMGQTIQHTRIGIGLNVNQREFRSDAPNPVSMVQLLGSESDISRVAVGVGTHLERRLRSAETPAGRDALHAEFKRRLWRGDGGEHPFRRRDTGETFPGIITDVSAEGPIEILDTASAQTLSFWFKEVEFIL
jgi:BirA family biotin operon repressor/biotin-[acetyl-CoA-carboxylase] ligase